MVNNREKSNPPLFSAAFAGVAVLIGLFVASPYVTTWQMKRAIESRDAISLADHIDFPAFKESVRGHLPRS